MNTFTFEKTLNKKALELINGYKILLDNNTSSFVKDAITQSILNEKAKGIRTAVKNKVSVEEFIEVLYSYKTYLSGLEEIQDAAIVFIENYIPTDTKVDIIKGNKDKVIIQKRIGLKSTDFQKYFGTSVEETKKLYDNGFAETFVNTRIRKCITDVVNTVKSKEFNITLSKCLRSNNRKLYNIAVNFEISIDKLNVATCTKIAEIITLLESTSADFTI